MKKEFFEWAWYYFFIGFISAVVVIITGVAFNNTFLK